MGQSDSGKFSATKVKKVGLVSSCSCRGSMYALSPSFCHSLTVFLPEVLDLIKEETQFLLDMKAGVVFFCWDWLLLQACWLFHAPSTRRSN